MDVGLRLLLLASLGLTCAWSQKGVGSSDSMNTGLAANASPRWSAATAPSGIAISGVVRMDDGSPLPGSVKIQMICAGAERIVAHTTPADDFGFQWYAPSQPGQPDAVGTAFDAINADGDAATRVHRVMANQSESCDLRAELGGYTSTEVSLGSSASFDNSSVGVIWLHRIAGNEGNMVSISTLRAPKDARKDFDKGSQLARAGNQKGAEECFRKALAIDPQFAEAWLSLGRIQFRAGSNDSARARPRRRR
jgi:hypothetical protein